MAADARRIANRWLTAQADEDDWLQMMLDSDDDEPDEPKTPATPTPASAPIPERESRAKMRAVQDFARRIDSLRNWRLVHKLDPDKFGHYPRHAARRTWIIDAPPLDTVLAGTDHDYNEGILSQWPEIMLMHDKGNGDYEIMLVPHPFATQLRGRYQDAKGMSLHDLAKGQRKALAGLKSWWLKTGTALAQGAPVWVPFRF